MKSDKFNEQLNRYSAQIKICKRKNENTFLATKAQYIDYFKLLMSRALSKSVHRFIMSQVLHMYRNPIFTIFPFLHHIIPFIIFFLFESIHAYIDKTHKRGPDFTRLEQPQTPVQESNPRQET